MERRDFRRVSTIAADSGVWSNTAPDNCRGDVKLPSSVYLRILSAFLLAVLCAQAQEKIAFSCNEEDLAAAGMSCSDQYPCPVYLELSSISASGKKLALVGNLHGASATLYSVLLLSDDGGANWKEPTARVSGAALDQVQLFDATHGWTAGETQVPLARDPFFLITSDGGASWKQKPVTEDGGVGAIQRFWFDTPSHGEVIVDAGRTAQGGRYMLYESHTGADNWNIVSHTTQVPRLRHAPALEDADYRLGTDSKSHTFTIEKRDGEKWNRVASFLIQVASCGTPAPPTAPPPVADTDAK
jgi:photosystem II stability/assembly factor-like uncharacterized protein